MAVFLIALLLGLGLAIRLYDLTDLPLDFHPTRQLLSQLKARGMYFQSAPDVPEWQRKLAVQQWRLRAEVEPEVFERLVALTYRFTGVDTSVARVYASIFWIAGSLFLFLVVRDLFSLDAAFVALAYFLFHPFAIVASRSFQPDVLMLFWLLCFWWAFLQWTRKETWPWVVIAGLAGGLAIYVKFVAVFFVLVGAFGMAAGVFGTRIFRKRQILAMAAIGALPALAYLYYGVIQEGFLGRQFSGRFVPLLLLEPAHYLRWAGMANLAAGGVAIALGLLGVLIVRDRQRRFVLEGMWIAYLLFGLSFNYHIASHDYYSLPLIAVVAVAMAPVLVLGLEQLAPFALRPLSRWAMLALLLYASFSGAWMARGSLAAVDYRPQAKMWEEIGARLNHGPNVVALTQDYGSRLAYWGWQNAIVWPYTGDFEYRLVRGGELDFEEAFTRLARGNTYFLVTDFEELDLQPELKQRLSTYQVFAEGDGYIVYDLERGTDQ